MWIGFGFSTKSTQCGKDLLFGIAGPILDSAPGVDRAVARAGEILTAIPGTYRARGGGTVSVVGEWLVGGSPVASGPTYLPLAAQAGQPIQYRETATETGGTHPGAITSPGPETVILPALAWDVTVAADHIIITSGPGPLPAPTGAVNGATITLSAGA